MAVDEASFRTELKKALKVEGAHVLITREMQIGGVPDLYFNAPWTLFGVWLELKFRKIEAPEPDWRRETPAEWWKTVHPNRLKTTPQQKAWLENEIDAGGVAGWVQCSAISYEGLNWGWALEVGLPANEFSDQGKFVQVRRRKQQWDVKLMTRQLTSAVKEVAGC